MRWVCLSAFLVLSVVAQGTSPVLVGSPAFIQRTESAIAQAPDWAQFQLRNTRIVRVDAVAGADLDRDEIRVTDIIWQSSTPWYVSTLVHEQWHLSAWKRCLVAGGPEGEAMAIRYQAVVLEQMGRSEQAVQILTHVGTHGTQGTYPPPPWRNPTCAQP